MTERRETKPHAIKALLSFWDERYTQHTNGTKYPFNGGKDAKLMHDLRALYTDDELRRFIVAFFEMRDEFFEHAGHSIGAFRACLPKVIRYVEQQRARAVTREPWVCRHVDPCSHRAMCEHKNGMPEKYPTRTVSA